MHIRHGEFEQQNMETRMIMMTGNNVDDKATSQNSNLRNEKTEHGIEEDHDDVELMSTMTDPPSLSSPPSHEVRQGSVCDPGPYPGYSHDTHLLFVSVTSTSMTMSCI